MNARKVFKSILVLGAMTAISTGCGRNLSGSWPMTISGSGGAITSNTACQSTTQVNFNITESGSGVTGNGSNSCDTYILSGTENNGTIQVSNMTMTPVSSTYSGGYNTTCVYTGTLTDSNNQIQGQLQIMNQAQGQGTYGICQPLLYISGTKS